LTIKKDGDKLAGTMSWPDQKAEKLKDPKLKDGTREVSPAGPAAEQCC
jgi:hypothetical protein